MDVTHLARDERADLADFLSTLSAPQWDAPTLCQRWRVRDVVAHLISYDDLDARGLLQRFIRGRFNADRANAVGVAEHNTRTPEDLLACLKDHLAPQGLPAGFGGRIALVDGLIHHQDIRRPLGQTRQIPPERLRPALSFALIAPPIRGFWRARGLRLVATDLDWVGGWGQLVQGPAEALLMAIAGRRGATEQLSGPGQPVLTARIGA